MLDYTEGQRLVADYVRTADPATRDLIVAAYQPMVEFLARQMAHHRHELVEELAQVANVGLLEALSRYDPDRGTQFHSFASVTIRGVMRHHMRNGWSLHVPRRVQELSMLLPHATEACAAKLRRTPTTAEVAQRCATTTIAVIDAEHAARNFHSLPLDADTVQVEAPDDLEAIDRRVDLAAMLDHLTPRRRAILDLRFRAQMSQSEIGEILGVSIPTVSREIVAALAHCRSYGPDVGA